MAEIIGQEEIQAVSDLVREFNRLGISIEEMIELGKENKTAINQAKTVEELTKKIDKLEGEQKKLAETNLKLKEAQDKSAKSAASQGEALDAVDNRMGGVIGRTKELGKQLWALVKNPVVLTLAAIVAALAACAAAAKVFFTTTGEGEDALDRQTSSWKQFFNVLKSNFADLGKSISGWFEKLGGSNSFILGTIQVLKIMFPFMSDWLNKVQADFIATEDDAARLTQTLDELEDRMILNITKRAETTRTANKLMLESEDKINKSSEERIALLQRGIDLKEKQLKEDVAIAQIAAKALLIEIGLEHGLSEEESLRMTQKQRFAKFTAEENKRIAEAYAEIINLDGAYHQEVKSNTTKIVALKEQLRKEIVTKAQAAAEKEIQESNNIVETQITNIKNRAVAGAISIAEAEKQIIEVRKMQADDLVNSQITALSKLLLTEELNAEERATIEQKLFDLKNQLVDEYFNQIEEKSKISFENIAQIYTDFTSALGNLFASFTEQRLQAIDQEEKRLEEFYETRIKMAGDNEERVSQIENEAERRRRDLENKRIQTMRRAAVFDKAISATQAAVATALAIVKMLAAGPAGIALSIAAGITGAIQVAAILAKPIPQYKDGGTTIAEWVIAGEEGIEKFRTPGGQVGYTPNRATLMKFPIGTEITNNDETMRGLAEAGMSNVGGSQGTQDDVGMAMLYKLDRLDNTIRNKRETHYNWTEEGLEKAFKHGESRTYFKNKFYH